MIFLYIAIFIFSCLLIILSSRWVIDALYRLTVRLKWKEFVVAFFTVSIGAVLPELFIGIRSALKGVPEMAFGSIIGQNIVLFTLSVAICTFILHEIKVESRTVRAGTTFALCSVILPFIFLLNGEISRFNGVILIAFCFLYIYWMFSERDRFLKPCGELLTESSLLKDIGIIFSGLLLVVVSAEGIVFTAQSFSETLNIPIVLFGVFAVGLGVALPETFFSAMLARKGQSWMILGGLMGAVALSSTLVLGIVALISPIKIDYFSPLAILFLIVGGVFLLFFVRTNNKITKKEAGVLLLIYFLFLFFEYMAL